MPGFKIFRYPRWQLFRQAGGCLPWLLVGAVVLTAPYGVLKWLGLLPLAGCGIYWFFILRPKLNYIIRTDEKRLCIGADVYRWNQLDDLKMERHNGKRSIHLTGKENNIDLTIKDDLPRFRELTQECLFYMSLPEGELEEEDEFRPLHHGKSIEKQIISVGKQLRNPRKH